MNGRIVERCDAVDEAGRSVIFEVAHVERQPAAIFLIVELAPRSLDVKVGGIAGAKIETQGAADPFAFHVIIAILQLERNDAAPVDPVVGFDVVGLKLASIIGNAAGYAEIVAKKSGEIEACFRRQSVGVIVITPFELDDQQVLLAIESAGCLDFDRSTDCVGIHVGSERFLHFDRFDDVAGDNVERDRAHIAFG